jgi:hypothetical protein
MKLTVQLLSIFGLLTLIAAPQVIWADDASSSGVGITPVVADFSRLKSVPVEKRREYVRGLRSIVHAMAIAARENKVGMFAQAAPPTEGSFIFNLLIRSVRAAETTESDIDTDSFVLPSNDRELAEFLGRKPDSICEVRHLTCRKEVHTESINLQAAHCVSAGAISNFVNLDKGKNFCQPRANVPVVKATACKEGFTPCNPFIFGTETGGGNFCVRKTANTNKSCYEISKETASFSFLEDDRIDKLKGEWDKFRGQFNNLCNQQVSQVAASAFCADCNALRDKIAELNVEVFDSCEI